MSYVVAPHREYRILSKGVEVEPNKVKVTFDHLMPVRIDSISILYPKTGSSGAWLLTGNIKIKIRDIQAILIVAMMKVLCIRTLIGVMRFIAT